MKNIYAAAFGLLAAPALFAQTSEVTPQSAFGESPASVNRHVNKPVDFSRFEQKGRAMQYRWYDHASAYSALYGTTPELYVNYLFPDTGALVDYGGTFDTPWLHSIGQIFDVGADVYNNGTDYNIDVTRTFKIDSISVLGYYERKHAGNYDDTLIISVVNPTANNLSSRIYFGPTSAVAANLGGDTVFMFDLKTNLTTMEPPAALATYKIVLDQGFWADSTAAGWHYAEVATGGLTIPVPTSNIAKGLFAITVTFKPGYPHTPNTATPVDTLGYNVNGWYFTSFELNGADTYPYYDKTDYNSAAVVTNQVLGGNAGSWNGKYIHSYAYMGSAPTYHYESHGIMAKLSQDDNAAIAENSTSNVKVYPNPARDEVKINFTASGNYNLVISDITGKVVMTENGNASGNLSKSLNTSALNGGVYFVTVNNNGSKSTSRLVVVK